MDRSHWALIGELLRPHRRAFIGFGLLLTVATALPIVGTVLIARFVDRLVDGRPWSETAPLLLMFIALGIATSIITVVVSWRSTQLAWRITDGLRHELAEHVLHADLAFHRDRTPGELLTRCDGDVTSLTTFLSAVVARLLAVALLVVASTAVLAGYEPRLAAAMAIGYLIVGIALWTLRDLSTAAVVDERVIDAEASSVAEQYLAGADEVAALGAGAYGVGRFGAVSGRLVDAIARRTRLEMRFQAIIKTLLSVVTMAVIALGAFGVRAGWTDVAGVVLAFRLVAIVRDPIERLTWRLQETQGISGAARRILDLVAERRRVIEGAALLPPGALSVEFIGTSLIYDDAADGEAALHPVDFEIPAGRTIGLVGRTGSGKTTLARLLLRLVAPTQGVLRIGGVDATSLEDAAFRQRVVAIPQDVQLFPGTVRDNVTMFAAVDDQRVIDSLDEAGLGPWLDGLAEGLDTRLASDQRSVAGSDGATDENASTGMSAGQAQLLSIARALLRDPDLIVLDEATSRVDPETQTAIAQATATLTEGRTAVIVAHRLETLDVCDDIVVLSGGKVVESGPRTELAAEPGSYYARLRAAGNEATMS